jgi:hypothetical protein
MKERTALLAAMVEAVSTRQAHEFVWLVKAAYGAGASREDLLIAVETGWRLGEPPEPITAEAYTAVHAWQWMANRRAVRCAESAPHADRRCSERRKAWLPCIIK